MARSSEKGWFGSLKAVFGCDPRSLAAFRIVMGVLILIDVAMRWPSLGAMMTDNGVIDRGTATQLLQAEYGNDASVIWSLNFLSGDLFFQQMLALMLVAAGILLSIGLATRWMTIACWVLVLSLHMRCPIILTSGDTLLRCMLFWSIFAPLGFCWSVDARLAKRTLADQPQAILTGGTVGLISQMIVMYFFAGLAKWNDIWWQGDAMDYVLRLDIYARPWASALLEYPLLLKMISWSTLFAELFLILLLLVPWQNTWWRTVNVLVYFGLHLSIASTMSIGLFSYLSVLGWLPLIPAAFWQLKILAGWGFEIPFFGYDYDDPIPDLVTAGHPQRDWNSGFLYLGNVISVLMVGYVVLWNVANVPNAYDGDLKQRLNLSDQEFADQIAIRRPFAAAMPSGLRWIGLVTGTSQHFQMFGVPPLINPWFVYDATLEDGSKIDLLRWDKVDYERPVSILYSINGHHWRKLHRNLLADSGSNVRQRLAEYQIRRWDQSHREGKRVRTLRVTCFAQKTGPQYKDEAVVPLIWYDTSSQKVESIEDLQKLLDSNPDLLPGFSSDRRKIQKNNSATLGEDQPTTVANREALLPSALVL